MNSIVLLTLSVLAIVVPAYGQFALPYATTDCTTGGLLDPFLIQTLKSKFPKKYSPKLDYAKDLALDAKYRLHTAKLLARHMKNLNSANCDLQNLMYQAQQPGMLQPMVFPDQSTLIAQQPQCTNFQIPVEAPRSLTLTPQADHQLCFSDPRYQQPTLQLTGAQRYGNPIEQCSTRCTKPECQCSSEEECNGGPIPNALSSVVSTFFGVLKNILK